MYSTVVQTAAFETACLLYTPHLALETSGVIVVVDVAVIVCCVHHNNKEGCCALPPRAVRAMKKKNAVKPLIVVLPAVCVPLSPDWSVNRIAYPIHGSAMITLQPCLHHSTTAQ